jgi:hypothetical protein
VVEQQREGLISLRDLQHLNFVIHRRTTAAEDEVPVSDSQFDLHRSPLGGDRLLVQIEYLTREPMAVLKILRHDLNGRIMVVGC